MRHHRNRISTTLVGLACVAALLGTAACGSSSSSSPAAGASSSGGAGSASGATDEVTVNALNIVSLAPLFVAEDKGFFAKQNIQNKYSAIDIYSQLAVQSQGNLDVNIPGLGGAFFNAINSGLKFKAVADRNQYRCTSDSMLLSGANSGITTVADLRGKKVAILAKGSSTEYWLDLVLEKAGMTQSDLGGVVNLTYPDTLNALKTGAIAAGFLTEPLANTAISTGAGKRLLATYQIAPNEEQGLITMSQKFLDTRSDVAQRWLAGWLQGVRFYLDPANKAEVVNIVAKHTSVPAATVSALYGTDQWPYMDPNGAVDTTTAMAQDGAWLLKNNVIKTLPAPSVWYDAAPLTAALKLAGQAPADNPCAKAPASAAASSAPTS